MKRVFVLLTSLSVLEHAGIVTLVTLNANTTENLSLSGS